MAKLYPHQTKHHTVRVHVMVGLELHILLNSTLNTDWSVSHSAHSTPGKQSYTGLEVMTQEKNLTLCLKLELSVSRS